MKYHVKASIHKMGKRCTSCTTHFEGDINAESIEQAISKAKAASRYNEATHQFKIQSIKEVSL
ncbi:hypothetical protein [Erwinia phage Snitter]|nr:hypothetical protein [Erwinia phage Snitter]